MKKIQRGILAISVMTVAVVVSATVAWAGDTAVYDWPAEDAPVLVKNDSGVILIGADAKPMRAFSWNANDGDHDQPVRLVDIRGDGTPEIVGSGTPTFALNASGEPMFSFEDGCRQVVVADLIQRTNLDIVCVNSGEARVYTDRGRYAWSVSPGRNLDWCVAGDLTNNTRNDLECSYRGSNQFLRLSYEGEVLVTDAENHNLEGAEENLDEAVASTEEVWSGDEGFDLDGNGEANITIEAVDGRLVVQKRGEEEALSSADLRGEPQASLIKDLDGEGAREVVLVTDQRIYIVSEGGEKIEDFSANAGQYSRVPHAELASVYVNGFGEAGEEAREAVGDVQDQIAQCYGNRLRSAPFAGSGRQVMQVIVEESGDIQQVQKRHSGVGDSQVEDCAVEALRGVSFPGAEEGQATVNVNVIFTFRDE